MIGSMIAKIRKDKNVSKTDLAGVTNINIGHLTHIEKEERNPSHKTLKVICNALKVPSQPLMYTYDIDLTEEQTGYNAVNHIIYDSVPVFDSIIGFQKCPIDIGPASFVLRIHDNSMSPKLKENDLAYVQINAPLNNKDLGIFEYNGYLIVRKFIVRKKDLVLRAEDNSIPDIIVTKDSDFYIVGKILGTVEK